MRDETSDDDLQRARPFVNEIWYALYSTRLQLRERKILSGHTSLVGNAAFAPDGNRILTSSFDGTTRLWDRDGGLIATLRDHTDSVWTAVFSPDGRRILTASRDNTGDGKPIVTLKGHTGWIVSANFSPDGRRILTGSSDNGCGTATASPSSRSWGTPRLSGALYFPVTATASSRHPETTRHGYEMRTVR
jgi:WD40 repeat protein